MDIFTSLLFPPGPAYIGPGAGFAVLGSFLALFAAFGLVAAAVVSWPFRAALRLLFRSKRPKRTGVRRVVVLGLDGLDPARCERLMDEGRLPALNSLRQQGSFTRLATTRPPISPVAWSTFMTGVDPGKHNIFDFLGRDLQARVPELSSAQLDTSIRPPRFRLLRKSRPFWSVLGDYGLFSTILRVPITFPPEPFHGACLSSMCVPDLRGTQGSFTCFVEEPPPHKPEGGQFVTVPLAGDHARLRMEGPPDRAALLDLRLDRDARTARLRVGRETILLREGHYSNWVPILFVRGPFRTVHGLCRFLLVSVRPFKLYVTPIQIDPEHPALPISHPAFYSIYLAKLHGPFATLGLAEDTWARNEGATDDRGFLDQAWDIHTERENMFLDALRRTRRGCCVCVFDVSDRIQHMFMRPGNGPGGLDPEGQREIDGMYERLDGLVARTLRELGPSDRLLVMSDHGFTSFRRGVNLNAWLREQGYLHVRPGHEDDGYLQAIDWERTRAYTFGLAGVYLNLRGREKNGIVDPAEAPALAREIAEKLEVLRDPADGLPAILAAHLAMDIYHGPYVGNAPDLVVGYERGFRAAWSAAVGSAAGPVFSDNEKAWSGDHCVDASLVPGALFSNRRLAGNPSPHIRDLAPTVLTWLGVDPPTYMDGTALTFTQ